jgi:hypothetical protein
MRFGRLSLVVVGGCFVVGAATLTFTGSVLLFDPQREVASAQLVDGWGHKQPLFNLAYLRVGVPKVEGAVQITCKNGSVVERGYVTPGGHTWQKMGGKKDCSTVPV